jgi:hypothetical protein
MFFSKISKKKTMNVAWSINYSLLNVISVLELLAQVQDQQ